MSKFDHPAASRWGLLLVGHGSREQVGIDEFLAVARLVEREVATTPAEPCFLEFAEPTIAEGFRRLVGRGVQNVVVVPVLLFSAGHARRDIPAEVARVAAEFPGVGTTQAEHLGCHPAMIALCRQRFDEAAPQAAENLPTALVMVGRGSHDAEATAEMQRFVARAAQGRGLADVRTCFVAMAEPSLESAIEEAAQLDVQRIVVQPHFLFGGQLVDRVGACVERFARRYADRQWHLARHLGSSNLLASAIADRAAQSVRKLQKSGPGHFADDPIACQGG